MASFAVYSELERDALHVARADGAYLLGPVSRLRGSQHRAVARGCGESGAQVVDSESGFLTEHVAFATRCEEGVIVFISSFSPAVEAIDKTGART